MNELTITQKIANVEKKLGWVEGLLNCRNEEQRNKYLSENTVDYSIESLTRDKLETKASELNAIYTQLLAKQNKKSRYGKRTIYNL